MITLMLSLKKSKSNSIMELKILISKSSKAVKIFLNFNQSTLGVSVGVSIQISFNKIPIVTICNTKLDKRLIESSKASRPSGNK